MCFTVTGTETIAVGGGSGGESKKEAVAFKGYLPENVSGSGFIKINLATSTDTANSFDSSLQRFNPKTAGYYQVNVVAKAQPVPSATDKTTADLQVRKNGENSLNL